MSWMNNNTINNVEEYLREQNYDIDEHDLKVIRSVEDIIRKLDIRLDKDIFEFSMNSYRYKDNEHNIKLSFNEKIKNKIPKSVKNHIFDELSKKIDDRIIKMKYEHLIYINNRNEHYDRTYQITFDYEKVS